MSCTFCCLASPEHQDFAQKFPGTFPPEDLWGWEAEQPEAFHPREPVNDPFTHSHYHNSNQHPATNNQQPNKQTKQTSPPTLHTAPRASSPPPRARCGQAHLAKVVFALLCPGLLFVPNALRTCTGIGGPSHAFRCFSTTSANFTTAGS